VGTCRCSACSTGPCKLWYPDQDHDGYGDKNATLGTTPPAIPGCVSAPDGGAPTPPAANYVEDNTDCYDKPLPDTKAPLVHPGQNGFYPTGYDPATGNTNYDYNCDGQQTKQYAEDPAGTCGMCGLIFTGQLEYCGETDSCSASQASSHTQSYHHCGFGGGRFFICSGSDQYAFHTIRDCGQAGTLYGCSTCQTAGVAPASFVSGTVNGTVQACN
jgi:hypothetical protein